MSGKNGKPRQGPDRLMTSSDDDIALGIAVEKRFVELCGAYLRVKGEQLNVPLILTMDMVRWREMRVRHKSRDLRNTRSELLSTREMAQWTLDVNNQLRNQPAARLEWRD